MLKAATSLVLIVSTDNKLKATLVRQLDKIILQSKNLVKNPANKINLNT